MAAGVERLAREPGGAGPDRLILVHDGGATAGRGLRSSPRSQRRPPSTAPRSRSWPLTETVKRVADGRVVETVDRTPLGTAQTPQGVRRDLLERAYAAFPPLAGPRSFTDEAALLEACTIPVHAVPGDPMNLKVTVPDDLDRVAAQLLGSAPPGAARLRVGFGTDGHPFGPGEPLALGGITIAGAPRLHGHSDGDVALHAVADALLGAAAWAISGRLFPAGPQTPAGIASSELLRVVDRAPARGGRAARVRST